MVVSVLNAAKKEVLIGRVISKCKTNIKKQKASDEEGALFSCFLNH